VEAAKKSRATMADPQISKSAQGGGLSHKTGFDEISRGCTPLQQSGELGPQNIPGGFPWSVNPLTGHHLQEEKKIKKFSAKKKLKPKNDEPNSPEDKAGPKATNSPEFGKKGGRKPPGSAKGYWERGSTFLEKNGLGGNRGAKTGSVKLSSPPGGKGVVPHPRFAALK